MKRCARCGRRLSATKPRVFSHFTHSYYCADVDECKKRTARAARKTEAVPA